MLARRIVFFWALVAPGLLGLGGCSAEKDTFVARNWHNLLAHYNGYFLGREKLKEVETTVYKGIRDDYSRPLAVLPAAGAASSQATLLDEAVKKASIPIQRHKNSDWVDDSYLVIGKARYYQDDYENAIHTFKWVNAKAKDPNCKHTALIWLLRTYTDMKEYSFAEMAANEAASKPLNKANRRDYYLTEAYFQAKQKDWDAVLGNVEVALPLMRRNLRRGRMEFLAGQLRQRLGDDPEAYKHYKMVLRCHPPYELEFNARLNIAQVTAPGDENGVKKIRKYFKKALKDDKNLEYKDQIYYEMAKFELKTGNVPLAITDDKLGLATKGKTTGIKGLTHLHLGQIYYEKVKRFDLAKKYYDSAVAALDTNYEHYKAVVKRQKTLVEFVAQYNIIYREDSLRRLAAMDSNALYALIDQKIADKQKADKDAEKKARRDARNADDPNASGAGSSLFAQTTSTSDGLVDPTAAAGQTWYFYNTSQLARGKALFTRKWGRRPLEDNWRRSKKEAVTSDDDPAAPGQDGAVAKTDTSKGKAKPDSAKGAVQTAGGGAGGKDSTALAKADSKGGKDAAPQSPAALRAPYLKDIPRTQAQMDESDRKLEKALFTIGKIYDQKLEEPANAIGSFGRQTSQYEPYEKTAEARYNLFLIFGKTKQKARQDSVKAILLAKHPESVFAKLAVNPNYLIENKAITEAAKRVYAQAYDNYKQEQYIEASKLVASIRKDYPENSFSDRVDLLAAILVAKTVDATLYTDSLRAFIRRHPKSDLVTTANQMIEVAKKLGAKDAGPADTSLAATVANAENKKALAAAPAWKDDKLTGEHYFIVLLPLAKLPVAEAKRRFADFNRLLYPQEGLSTTDQLFDDKTYMIRVATLRNKLVAEQYIGKQNSLDGALDDLNLNPRPQEFIITPDNFQLLYRTKNITAYKAFYNQHYR